MKKLSITSALRDGAEVTGVVTEQQWLCLREIHDQVGRQAAIPIDVEHLKERVRRVLVYDDGKIPMLATVRRNRGGIYVKLDGAGGQTYSEEVLRGRLFPLDAATILISRWATSVINEIDKFTRSQ